MFLYCLSVCPTVCLSVCTGYNFECIDLETLFLAWWCILTIWSCLSIKVKVILVKWAILTVRHYILFSYDQYMVLVWPPRSMSL